MLVGPIKGVSTLCVLPKGTLASGSGDATICLWDTQSGQRLKSLIGHAAFVTSIVCFSNQKLASASRDDTVRIWDVERGIFLLLISIQDLA